MKAIKLKIKEHNSMLNKKDKIKRG